MFASIIGPGTRVSDKYFLTDHVCNADRQRAEAAAGIGGYRELFANQSCLCP